MSHDESLDDLVGRLQDSAAGQEPGHPPMGPPQGEWYRRLTELRERQAQPIRLFDPAAPRLGELLVLDRPARFFVEGLYRHLLGRPGDSEGIEHYLGRVEAEGRLILAMELAAAPEAARHREASGQCLPALVRRGLTWRRRLNRLLPWNGAGERLWRRGLAALDRRHRGAWALEGATCRLLVQQDGWDEERRQLASAVLEMGDRQRHFGARQDHEYAGQRALWAQLAAARRGVQREVAAAETAPGTVAPSAAAGAPADAGLAAELDAYYLAFEAAFRGPEQDVATHLDHYREDWTRARQAGEYALDLGCGRGEWLRLLAQAGFRPRGIDLNVSMVAHCKDLGFDVEHRDALAALEACDDDSLALISGFHIAEHLPFEVLFRLVGEAYRVLAPGGMLILETPNPENLIVASYSFYHDPTHRNPLTPPTLAFLCQFHGFGEARIRRFNPPPEDCRLPGEGAVVERLNDMLASAMDYAVVARKEASVAEEEA